MLMSGDIFLVYGSLQYTVVYYFIISYCISLTLVIFSALLQTNRDISLSAVNAGPSSSYRSKFFLVIGLLALAGLPPFSSFFAKFLLLIIVGGKGGIFNFFALIILTLSSILVYISFLKVFLLVKGSFRPSKFFLKKLPYSQFMVNLVFINFFVIFFLADILLLSM